MLESGEKLAEIDRMLDDCNGDELVPLSSIGNALRKKTRGVTIKELKRYFAAFNKLGLKDRGGKAITLSPESHSEYVDRTSLDPPPSIDSLATAVQAVSQDEHLPLLDIPYRRNQYFTGRTSHLNNLQTKLASPGSQVIAISGLGGIGKTQLAVEYAYRFGTGHSHILWTSADTEGSLANGYSAIARKLGLPVDYSDPNGAIPMLHNWMAKEDNWVLFLDNADHPKALDRFIPNHLAGHIVLTSRARVFDRLGPVELVELDYFTEQESLEFLLFRTAKTELTPPESEAARLLAKQLGGLALALEQAAAYIKETETPFHRYLSLLRSTGLSFLKKHRPEIGNYPETVATTWYVNFREVAAESPASIELLCLASDLRASDEGASLPIPYTYITDNPEALDDSLASTLRHRLLTAHDATLELTDILLPLVRFSLVRIAEPEVSFAIHPLVLEASRTFSQP